MVAFKNAVTKVAELPQNDAAHRRIVFDNQHRLSGAAHDWDSVSGFVHRSLRRDARQIEPEGRAHSRLAVDVHMAARLPQEAEHHAEAETGSLAPFLGGEERL